MYGKIENGALTVAPREIDGIIDPPAEVYIANGWLPVTFANRPNPSSESGWQQIGNTIIQLWTPPAPDPDIDDTEAFEIIFGGGNE